MTYFQKQSKKEVVKKLKELETRDWNRNWPTATKEAPIKCSSCDRKLEKPRPKGELLLVSSRIFPDGLESSSNKEWRIDCKCGVCYIWSYPNVWKRTHREVELMMYVNEDGSLLRPKRVKL